VYASLLRLADALGRCQLSLPLVAMWYVQQVLSRP